MLGWANSFGKLGLCLQRIERGVIRQAEQQWQCCEIALAIPCIIELLAQPRASPSGDCGVPLSKRPWNTLCNEKTSVTVKAEEESTISVLQPQLLYATLVAVPPRGRSNWTGNAFSYTISLESGKQGCIFVICQGSFITLIMRHMRQREGATDSVVKTENILSKMKLDLNPFSVEIQGTHVHNVDTTP